MQSCSCCIYESEDADKSYTLLKLSLYESYYYISEQEMNPVLVLKVHVHSHSSQYVMCLTKLWPFVRVIGMINGFLRFDAFHLSSDIFWWTSLKVLLFLLLPLISPQFWYLFHLGIGRAEKHFRGPRHSWHFCESQFFPCVISRPEIKSSFFWTFVKLYYSWAEGSGRNRWTADIWEQKWRRRWKATRLVKEPRNIRKKCEILLK